MREDEKNKKKTKTQDVFDDPGAALLDNGISLHLKQDGGSLFKEDQNN